MQGLTGQQVVEGLIESLSHLYQFLQRPYSPDECKQRTKEDNAEDTTHFDVQSLNSEITECKKQKLMKEHQLSNKPKKPISSFVFYFRQQLKRRDHPSNEKEVGKLAKIISHEWNKLPIEMKEPFNIKAEQSKREYEENMKKFNVEHANQIEEIQKLKRIANNKMRCLKRRQDNKAPETSIFRKKYKKHTKPQEPDIGIKKPKIPLSSFFVYFQENGQRISQTHKEKRRSRLVQLASDEWKAMNKEDKQRYQSIAKAKKEVYEKQIEQYNIRVNQFKATQKMTNAPISLTAVKENNVTKVSIMEKPKPVILKKEQESDSDSDKKEPDSLGCDTSSVSSTSSILDHELSSSSSYIEESTTKPSKTQLQVKIEQMPQYPPKLQAFTQESVDKGKKKCKRGKRSKQSHQPKGPVSSFFLYYNCIVRELKKEFSEMKGSELVKIASERWGKFPEEEKEIYQEQAKRGRALYDIEMDKFKKEYPEEASKLKYFQTKKQK